MAVLTSRRSGARVVVAMWNADEYGLSGVIADILPGENQAWLFGRETTLRNETRTACSSDSWDWVP